MPLVRSVRALPLAVAPVAVVAAVLTGCATGADDDPEPPVTEDAQEPMPEDDDQERLPEEVEPVAPSGDIETVTAEPTPGTLAVTEVRVGGHDGFDRVVFETEGGGVPGWHVGYGEASEQGSGASVELAGDAALVVMIRGVTLPPELPASMEVWEQQRVEGTGEAVREVVTGPLYEGEHQFFVGAHDERRFAVALLRDPDRVVVDVFHG